MAMTVVTFAILLGIIRITAHQNFVIMACGLLVEFAWLIGVILISLLLRVGNDQIKSAFRIYSPLMLVGFLVITFRIILIPNSLVNFIFPLSCSSVRCGKGTSSSSHSKLVLSKDKTYAYISLCVFAASTILFMDRLHPAVGADHHLVDDATHLYSEHHLSEDGWRVYAERKNLKQKPITDKWIFRFINKVLIPVRKCLVVYRGHLLGSRRIQHERHHMDDFQQGIHQNQQLHSLALSISLVACLFFLFNYINITTNDLMRHHFEKQDPASAASKIVMFKNVLQVIIWGIWLMVALNVFQVGKSWLLAIFAGLSTGLGFASKDILGKYLLW